MPCFRGSGKSDDSHGRSVCVCVKGRVEGMGVADRRCWGMTFPGIPARIPQLSADSPGEKSVVMTTVK